VKQQIYNTALYCRLSRDDELQGESSSISTQRQMLRQYATERGWNIIDEYLDDGWSGTNFQRPSFERMIIDIEDGKINCVITKDLSRLGRNYILTGQYTELYFPSKGVRYIAINDNVDTANGENEIVPFKNIINEWVARDTSRKVKSALKTKFDCGAHYGAYAPLGYKKHPEIKGKLIVDENTKWIVEKIFDLAAHGMGAGKIHKILRNEKVPTPSWIQYQRDGKFAHFFTEEKEDKQYRWTIVAVKHILADEVYIGNSIHYRQSTISFKDRKRVNKPKDEWVRTENTHEPIISKELWDLAQVHIDDRKRQTKKGESQIFAGILKCSDCGWGLRMSTNYDKYGNKRKYYNCTKYAEHGKEVCTIHSIRYDMLYAFVLGRLQYWLQEVQRNETELLNRLLKSGDKQREAELKHAKKELQKAEKRQKELDNLFAKLYEDRANGGITERNYAMLSGKYQTEQQQLEALIESLTKKLKQTEQDKQGAKKWITLIKKYEDLSELTAPLLNELIEKIVIHQAKNDENGNRIQDVDIYYRFVGKID